ncbi:N-acetyl sugar amidotransferase [Pseudomonas sp. 43mfcvi1.1]|uniref:N-acetyl sugar amidotransferase n=1 Tax=Pseudomonas TaxID=286 RepID=UPI000D6B31FB|nr:MULTISPECIES: N-acetyl sugar amidotransferase [Pseudomonas]AXP02137.1 N-acetyl sugar amidotransferase [Pseudomonas fluorescens]MCD9115605.1 N-acetyl sugar amidotransferase [Pseudomonas bijieensis]PWJ41255.1 N-acetyl sugar amidotransferase [Pseudomonas sp. 43mfcvi1.1]UQI32760.1 N-acetyl sugar amidotransferase [Pseudomonas bijieensis]SSB94408.1 N-acetyl sugar amidotransferase [Pseudomonas sp. 43mfcvi1.1]
MYKVCSRCVMDETDANIKFDEHGVCNHCHKFDEVQSLQLFGGVDGKTRLQNIVDKIKKEGAGKEYDCIIGLSGGVDSSYLAVKIKDFGLRPLVVHVDAGWNSELAVSNIEKIIKYCGYDLHTHVMNWEEMRDLQLSYMKAAVANQDVPQDHAFFSSMYHFAVKNDIKYILSGGNLATEAVFPDSWHGSAMDAINLKDIHRTYGSKPLRDYKTISFFEYYFWYPFAKGMRTVRPLNFMEYDKREAEKYLQETVGYRSYARKHGESIFTKLFQNYYLPTKFGYDKRKLHYSSMILSGQMSREEAIVKLAEPLYAADELENDIDYFCKKMRVNRQQFDELMQAPIHDYSDFKSWDKLQGIAKKSQVFLQKILGRRLSVYS